MKSEESMSKSTAADEKDRKTPVTSLTKNDVLLGRGSGSNEYIGNLRFRNLVEARKEEYISAKKREEKKEVAKEVHDKIVSLGGRFLRKAPKRNVEGVIVNNGEWVESDLSTALEKCKQALRQNREKRVPKDDAKETARASRDQPNQRATTVSSQPPVRSNQRSAAAPLADDRSNATSPLLPSEKAIHNGQYSSEPVPPPDIHKTNQSLPPPLSFLGETPFSYVDPRLLLFQNAQFALQQQPELFQAIGRSVASLNQNQNGITALSHASTLSVGMRHGLLLEVYKRQMLDLLFISATRHSSLHSQVAARSDNQQPGTTIMLVNDGNNETEEDTPLKSSPTESTMVPHATPDTEDAVFALSTLVMADRPKFTDQQYEEEQASLTDEERMAALADKFGKLCNVSTGPQRKRPNLDLDRNSIDFLVQHIKLELERVPEDEKLAFLEAQSRGARAEEFGDTRLLQFLRSEGMNVKLAARRFVKYWECRKQVFGPEKYSLGMTLSEALRDDLQAIEVGVLCLLPQPDLSGRPLLFMEPHRYAAGASCTPESLLRAMWYMMEVTAQSNEDIGSGGVLLGWDKYTTVFDLNRSIYYRFIEYEKNCLPVRFVAVHSCCPTSAIMKIMKPAMLALTDKRTRARTLTHDVPENDDLIDVLQEYGIGKDMIPTEMGGTVELNQREWLANRRAMEMEEIV